MADQDRNNYGRDRDRDVYMDNRTGIGAQSKGYRAEWGRGGDNGRSGDREQNYNQRRGENASFAERDYGQAEGGRTGYLGRDDDRRYGARSDRYGQNPSYGESYGQGRYSQQNSRYAAHDNLSSRNDRQSWASYPARSNPDFYADEYGSAGAGWAEDFSDSDYASSQEGYRGRDRSLESYRGQNRDQQNRGYGGGQQHNRGSDRYGMGYGGARQTQSYEADYGRGDQDRGGEGRGFWDRAADKVASWFGGEESRGDYYEGRESHRGKGPKGYRRSDERVREDVSDRLSDDHWLDASDIEVKVDSSEVTLTGTVKTRDDKRRAEQLAEQVSGVDNVQNNLRVQKTEDWRTSGQGSQAAGMQGGFGSDTAQAVPARGAASTGGTAASGGTSIPASTTNMGDVGTAKTGKTQ